MVEKVFEYVVYTYKEVISVGTVVAKDSNHALILVGGDDEATSREDVEVNVRPFCR